MNDVIALHNYKKTFSVSGNFEMKKYAYRWNSKWFEVCV